MAKQLSNYDYQQNNLLNAALHQLASAPSTPVKGQFYMSTATNTLHYYNGTTDYDSGIAAHSISELASPTGALAMAGQRITGMANGVNTNDAATMANLQAATDALIGGLVYKTVIRSVYTSNQSLTAAASSNDSLTINVGDRVLLAAQTTATQNGSYTYGTGGALTRAGDSAQNYELQEGSSWIVAEGTAGANQIWRVSTTGTITVGTTSVSIANISTAGTLYTATANGGLILSGTAFALNKVLGSLNYVPGVYSTSLTVVSGTSGTITHGLNSKGVSYSLVDSAGSDCRCEMAYPTTTTATYTITTTTLLNPYAFNFFA